MRKRLIFVWPARLQANSVQGLAPLFLCGGYHLEENPGEGGALERRDNPKGTQLAQYQGMGFFADVFVFQQHSLDVDEPLAVELGE
jgi:hypothetical protein